MPSRPDRPFALDRAGFPLNVVLAGRGRPYQRARSHRRPDQPLQLQPIARLGYRQFAVIRDLFEMPSEEFQHRGEIFSQMGRR